MNHTTHEQPRIVAAAERQMQTWVRSQGSASGLSTAAGHPVAGGPQSAGEHSTAGQAVGRIDHPLRTLKCGPYLAISREAGAGASLVAQRIGQELGWQVMDGNVLDQIAEKYHMPKEMLQLLDETHSSIISNILGALIDQSLISPEKYVIHLGRMILAAARRGKVVFVGRGAPYVLPRAGGLTIRIVAPEEFRIQRIMKRLNLNAVEARRRMEKVDRGRSEFVQRYFHRDIANPRHYDMVVNSGRLGIDAATNLILVALRSFQPAAV